MKIFMVGSVMRSVEVLGLTVRFLYGSCPWFESLFYQLSCVDLACLNLVGTARYGPVRRVVWEPQLA